MKPKYRVASVADVRRLATCRGCGRLGMHGVDLLLVKFDADSRGRKRNKQFAHPICLFTDDLLALPAEELGNVRISDVSPEVLQRILDRLAKIAAEGR